jgi:uncharacterized protein (DUF342 family)
MQAIAHSKFAEVLMLLNSAKKNPEKFTAEALAEAEAARVTLYDEIAVHTADALQIKKEINLAKEAQVVASGKIFAGVEIHIGQKYCEIKQDREGGVFKLGDMGEIVFNQIGNPP